MGSPHLGHAIAICAALIAETKAEKKIYARPTYGSNKQFLMGGNDLTFPVRVYPAGIRNH